MSSLFFSTLTLRRLCTRLSAPAFVAAAFIAAAPGLLPAQTSNEFFPSSMLGVPTGPIATQQTARLLLNSNNPSGDTLGTTTVDVSVTASISNQQYTGVGTGTGNPVVMFGGTNTSGSGGPGSMPVFGLMNSVGSPTSSQFSNTVAGTATGMNVTANYAFDMYTSVRHWGSGAAPATTGRVHMADLTLTFSSPVTNPLLHFVGLGGTSGGLGFGSEFTLTTPGLTLTKVQGNAALSVSSTQINNGTVSGIAAACSGNAGCGTVRLNGSNITTVTFQVYVRGDGAAAAWSGTATHPGDRFLLGVSLPESYTVSGNVFLDSDGPGSINGVGTGTAGGTQLHANLVDPTDNSVVASVAVNADGTFNLPGVPASGVNYRVEISINQGVPLSPAPPAVLPTGWSSVGENLGSGAGNDGSADRSLSVTVGSAAPANTNFGIIAGTTAADVTISGRVRTSAGRGIRNVAVSLAQPDGTLRTTLTGAFGFYSFDGVPAGQSVVVGVRSKRYQFANPFLLVDASDDFADVDFVAVP